MLDHIEAISCKGHTFKGVELTRPFFLSKRDAHISMIAIDAIAEIVFTKYDTIITVNDVNLRLIVNGKPIEGIWYRVKTNTLEIHLQNILETYNGTWCILITRSKRLETLITLFKIFGIVILGCWLFLLISREPLTEKDMLFVRKSIIDLCKNFENRQAGKIKNAFENSEKNIIQRANYNDGKFTSQTVSKYVQVIPKNLYFDSTKMEINAHLNRFNHTGTARIHQYFGNSDITIKEIKFKIISEGEKKRIVFLSIEGIKCTKK